MLKRLSERCRLIAVRGEFSAAVLERYGVKNTKIIGCPSLYYPFIRRGLKGIERSGDGIRTVVNSAGSGNPGEKSGTII